MSTHSDIWHFEVDGTPICRFSQFGGNLAMCQVSSRNMETAWDDFYKLGQQVGLNVMVVKGPCPYHRSPEKPSLLQKLTR